MNLCCKGSLQTGVKIIAIVQILVAILVIGSGIAALAHEDARSIIKSLGFSKVSSDSEVMVSSISQIVGGLFAIIAAIVLLFGARRRNRKACIFWFIVNAFWLVCSLFLTTTVYSQKEFSFFAGWVMGVLLLTYFLRVVWAFMKELRQDERAESQPSNVRNDAEDKNDNDSNDIIPYAPDRLNVEP